MKLELKVDESDASGEDSRDESPVEPRAVDESRSFEGILDWEFDGGSEDVCVQGS